MTKYILTDETASLYGKTLYRIQAVKDFSDVKAGDKGGFVEKECNLSHEGDCWIYDNGVACGNSLVVNNAIICDEARIHDNSYIGDYAILCNKATLFSSAKLLGHAVMTGCAKASGNSIITDYSRISDSAYIKDSCFVCHNSKVCGSATLRGGASITKDSVVCRNMDYITFYEWWLGGDVITWTRSNDLWSIGGEGMTASELLNEMSMRSDPDMKEYERLVRYVDEIKQTDLYQMLATSDLNYGLLELYSEE